MEHGLHDRMRVTHGSKSIPNMSDPCVTLHSLCFSSDHDAGQVESVSENPRRGKLPGLLSDAGGTQCGDEVNCPWRRFYSQGHTVKYV